MKRSEQRKEDTWDLESLCPDSATWKEEAQKTLSDILRIETYKGKLAQGSDMLYEALCQLSKSAEKTESLCVYATCLHECDGTDSTSQELAGLASTLQARLVQSTSWMDPEIMTIDPALLSSWLEEERFKDFRVYISRLLHMKEHTLSDQEERILALNSEASEACSDAFNDLNDIDLDFGEVKGQALTHASYSAFMRSDDEEVRKEAYRKLYHEYFCHRHVLSRLYAGSVNQDIFYARARGYESSLQAALFPDNVPQDVYTNLIDSIHSSFDALHRYYSLRCRLLEKERIAHYDVYLPMVSAQEKKISYDEAVCLISEAVRPLGEEYRSTLVRGLTSERWADRYENEGKRSGAFSISAYRSKPFILTSYRDDILSSVFTLIHEGGHSMHSFLSAQSNSFMQYNYTIFEAEVASTFNEELLSRYLISHTSDSRLKAHLIANRLDDIVATLFRQTMFAEFELLVHQEVESGRVATLDFMRKTYRGLLESYFGDRVVFEEESDLECLRIPHFYRAFYVYKYATGISAAIALCNKVLEGGDKERNDYLSFLKSGGSKYPIDSLKCAGVDMRCKESVLSAVSHFTSLMDELESLLPR